MFSFVGVQMVQVAFFLAVCSEFPRAINFYNELNFTEVSQYARMPEYPFFGSLSWAFFWKLFYFDKEYYGRIFYLLIFIMILFSLRFLNMLECQNILFLDL